MAAAIRSTGGSISGVGIKNSRNKGEGLRRNYHASADSKGSMATRRQTASALMHRSAWAQENLVQQRIGGA
jgi:hypothetical protein